MLCVATLCGSDLYLIIAKILRVKSSQWGQIPLLHSALKETVVCLYGLVCMCLLVEGGYLYQPVFSFLLNMVSFIV